MVFVYLAKNSLNLNHLIKEKLKMKLTYYASKGRERICLLLDHLWSQQNCLQWVDLTQFKEKKNAMTSKGLSVLYLNLIPEFRKNKFGEGMNR